MRILITGGAGFIGAHLAEKLLDAGENVTVVDDLSTGSLKNIEKIRQKAGFAFIREDVRNIPTMTTLVEQCDVVIHLAAAVGVNLTVDEPVRTIETNVHGTEVILDLANKFGRKVLLASSSDVYGKSDAVPFHCMIAYDSGTYRTIGASFEFGGLVEAASPNTHAELMDAIVEFLAQG